MGGGGGIEYGGQEPLSANLDQYGRPSGGRCRFYQYYPSYLMPLPFSHTIPLSYYPSYLIGPSSPHLSDLHISDNASVYTHQSHQTHHTHHTVHSPVHSHVQPLTRYVLYRHSIPIPHISYLSHTPTPNPPNPNPRHNSKTSQQNPNPP